MVFFNILLIQVMALLKLGAVGKIMNALTPTPKVSHVLIPGYCDYVMLHGKGQLIRKMELSLLINRP